MVRVRLGEEELTVSRGEVTVSGREVTMAVKLAGSGRALVEVLAGALEDVEGRPVAAAAVTREVTAACGPEALARREMDVCRCRRSSTRCECACGGIGAAMEYWGVCWRKKREVGEREERGEWMGTIGVDRYGNCHNWIVVLWLIEPITE